MTAPALQDDLPCDPDEPLDERLDRRPVTGVRRIPAALRAPALREPGERDAIVPDPPA